MIEIGKNFLFGLSSAHKANKTRQEKNAYLADQTDELARQYRENYEQKTAYLFRTAAEKMMLATEQARQALAQRQAQQAAHGVSERSAARTTELSGQLAAAQTQAQLQRAAAQEENTFKTRWQQLLKTAADYRRRARKSGLWGTLKTLFK